VVLLLAFVLTGENADVRFLGAVDGVEYGAECVYANTLAYAKGGEDLRTLLKDYIGYEMSTLIKDEVICGTKEVATE
jgi:hypothetical protein